MPKSPGRRGCRAAVAKAHDGAAAAGGAADSSSSFDVAAESYPAAAAAAAADELSVAAATEKATRAAAEKAIAATAPAEETAAPLRRAARCPPGGYLTGQQDCCWRGRRPRGPRGCSRVGAPGGRCPLGRRTAVLIHWLPPAASL